MNNKKLFSNKIINIVGWVLFLISAIGFIMSSLGNFWAMFGSIFLFCWMFSFFDTLFFQRKLTYLGNF